MYLKQVSRPRFFTDEEKELIKKMFADNYTISICRLINRSYSSVCRQAGVFGLKKSDAFRKMEMKKQGERLRNAGAGNRFKKGNVSFNKGKAMPRDVYEKIKHTMFKKGALPHNTKYDGHERINADGYTEVRVRLGKYVCKHRMMWEQQHGKIPEGFIVVFKDRNPQNLTVENLELITRKENMMRNTIHRFPEELKSAIKLVNKLKRKISEKQNYGPA